MKDFIFDALIFFSRGVYWLLKQVLPAGNTVVFLSRQSNEPSVDFRLLQEELELQMPTLRQKLYCRRMDGDGAGSLADLLSLVKPTLALLTARGCFVDGQCIPLSLYKQRKGFVAAQVWHSLGALKKFGWQAIDKPDGRSMKDAVRWNMHGNYSFVSCASETTRKHYSECFNMPEKNVLVLGMPRVDEIMRIADNKALPERIYSAHPSWRGKFKLLYVPTFRRGKALDIEPLLKVLTAELRKKYKLIVKVHPNDKKPDAPSDIAFTSIPTLEMFSVADAIITDYSAAAFECSPFGKPLYFYVPDFSEYESSTGLNINFDDEMPGTVFSDFSQLMSVVERGDYDISQLERFRKKYVTTADKNNTQRIVAEFIRRLQENAG